MDIATLLREHLDQARDGDYHLDAVAAEFCTRMAAEHPDDWEAWLLERAPVFVRREMGRIEGMERSKARSRAKARSFGKAVDGGDVGDYFLSTAYVVDEENRRRTMAEMTAQDHRFVADRYEVSGKEALMQAAFHRAIAKRLTGGKKTADVFNEQQLATIWGRLAPS